MLIKAKSLTPLHILKQNYRIKATEDVDAWGVSQGLPVVCQSPGSFALRATDYPARCMNCVFVLTWTPLMRCF